MKGFVQVQRGRNGPAENNGPECGSREKGKRTQRKYSDSFSMTIYIFFFHFYPFNHLFVCDYKTFKCFYCCILFILGRLVSYFFVI